MELTDFQLELEKRLTAIGGEFGKTANELKAALDQRIEQMEQKGFVDPELKEKVDRIFTRMDGLEAQWNHSTEAGGVKAAPRISSHVLDSEGFKAWAESGFRTKSHSRYPIDGTLFPQEWKVNPISVTGLGSATTGVMPIQRIGETIAQQRRELRIRDLIPTFPTKAATIDYLRQTGFTNSASPQVEAAAKAESTITWDSVSTPVRTLAHFIKVTTQALADVPQMRADIDDLLMYGLKLKEEDEILTGSGVGQHLNGIVTQATAYSTGYNVSGDTKLDKIRHGILQSRLALYPVDGIVLNPRDLHDMELIKTEEGAANKGMYVVGDPKSGTSLTFLWGKPVVESDAMTYGTFLVGAFAFGARIFDRLQAVVDISLEDSDNFEKNLATLRAEERLALAIVRPASFIYGSF